MAKKDLYFRIHETTQEEIYIENQITSLKDFDRKFKSVKLENQRYKKIAFMCSSRTSNIRKMRHWNIKYLKTHHLMKQEQIRKRQISSTFSCEIVQKSKLKCCPTNTLIDEISVEGKFKKSYWSYHSKAM